MSAKEVLPECAANIAILTTKQQALGADMKEVTNEVKDLSRSVERLVMKLEPIIDEIPKLTQPSPSCPLYISYLDNQKKNLKLEMSGKVQPAWLSTIVKSKLIKAIITIITFVLIGIATYIGE